MQPAEFQVSLTRAHYVTALEGTNNLLFYLAISAEIHDRQMSFPPTLVSSLGLPPDVKTMFDYRSRYPGIYNRLYQFCIISLCADIEAFFKAIFSERGYPPGAGSGFYQRFDDVVSVLSTVGFDFSPLANELNHLRHAFQVRHICIHNFGLVDQYFASNTKLPVNIGDVYVIAQGEYRLMFDAYALFLTHIDTNLAHA